MTRVGARRHAVRARRKRETQRGAHAYFLSLPDLQAVNGVGPQRSRSPVAADSQGRRRPWRLRITAIGDRERSVARPFSTPTVPDATVRSGRRGGWWRRVAPAWGTTPSSATTAIATTSRQRAAPIPCAPCTPGSMPHLARVCTGSDPDVNRAAAPAQAAPEGPTPTHAGPLAERSGRVMIGCAQGAAGPRKGRSPPAAWLCLVGVSFPARDCGLRALVKGGLCATPRSSRQRQPRAAQERRQVVSARGPRRRRRRRRGRQRVPPAPAPTRSPARRSWPGSRAPTRSW